MGSKPLRGKKGTRHEGGTRVPLMVGMGQTQSGSSIPEAFPDQGEYPGELLWLPVPISCPTILRIAGVRITRRPASLDGFDISPYFSGEDARRPQEFLVHFPHAHTNNLFSTFIKDGWKVIYSYASEDWELYELSKDPYESRNLAKEFPDRLQSMAPAHDREVGQRTKPPILSRSKQESL